MPLPIALIGNFTIALAGITIAVAAYRSANAAYYAVVVDIAGSRSPVRPAVRRRGASCTPGAIAFAAQNQVLAGGKALVKEEEAKRVRHGLDMWDVITANWQRESFRVSPCGAVSGANATDIAGGAGVGAVFQNCGSV